MPSFILIRPTFGHSAQTSQTGHDRQSTDRQHRANGFTNGRPKTPITGAYKVLYTSKLPCVVPQRYRTASATKFS